MRRKFVHSSQYPIDIPIFNEKEGFSVDDLLLKTVQFFFVPEAILSVIFLLIFIGMFLLGLKWVKHCRKALTILQEQAVSDYVNIQNKLTPQAFLRIRLSVLNDVENRLEELPSTFINVGILATFLGLGVAIQGAADLLHESVMDLTRLTDVLSVIAFKFQTSVWGICFSLIFQKFFVDTYFSARQDLIDELTEALFARRVTASAHCSPHRISFSKSSSPFIKKPKIDGKKRSIGDRKRQNNL